MYSIFRGEAQKRKQDDLERNVTGLLCESFGLQGPPEYVIVVLYEKTFIKDGGHPMNGNESLTTTEIKKQNCKKVFDYL